MFSKSQKYLSQKRHIRTTFGIKIGASPWNSNRCQLLIEECDGVSKCYQSFLRTFDAFLYRHPAKLNSEKSRLFFIRLSEFLLFNTDHVFFSIRQLDWSYLRYVNICDLWCLLRSSFPSSIWRLNCTWIFPFLLFWMQRRVLLYFDPLISSCIICYLTE